VVILLTIDVNNKCKQYSYKVQVFLIRTIDGIHMLAQQDSVDRLSTNRLNCGQQADTSSLDVTSECQEACEHTKRGVQGSPTAPAVARR
jgi:hypothetical protein